MRLDSICFNLGFSSTIPGARQIINHGHILVNNKAVNIASFQCRPSDVISIKNKNSSKSLVENNLKNKKYYTPSHLEFSEKKVQGTVKTFCNRDDISLNLNELLVIEYYSRR